MKSRILVIDDEAEIRRSVRMILEYEGYDVIEASSGPDGVALADRLGLILLVVRRVEVRRAGREFAGARIHRLIGRVHAEGLVARAAAYCSSVSAPSSFVSRSTRFRRASARAGWRCGS